MEMGFIDKWTSDSRLVLRMKKLFSLYMNQFSDENEFQMLIYKFYENIKFYDKTNFDIVIDKYVNKLDGMVDTLPGIVKIVALIKDYVADKKSNANYYHNSDKTISQIGSYYHVEHYYNVVNLEDVNSMILVDDYCGTGTTFEGAYKKIRSNGYSGKIIFFPVVLNKFGKRRLDELSTIDNDFTYDFVELTDEKQFSNSALFSDEDRETYKRLIEYYNIDSDYKGLGFKKVEDYIAFYTYTPNNSMDIFWNESGFCKTFFQREDNSFCLKRKRYFYDKNFCKQINKYIRSKKAENINKAKIIIMSYLNKSKIEIKRFVHLDEDDDFDILYNELENEKILVENKVNLSNAEKYIDSIGLQLITELGVDNSNDYVIGLNVNSINH